MTPLLKLTQLLVTLLLALHSACLFNVLCFVGACVFKRWEDRGGGRMLGYWFSSGLVFIGSWCLYS